MHHGGAGVEPREVAGVGGGDGAIAGARVTDEIAIAPFADFGVAIGETEAAGVIVVDSGFIDPTGGFGGVGYKRTIVDTEVIFVDEDEGHRGTGLGEIGLLVKVFAGGGVGDGEIPTVEGGEPAIHGHAADMREKGAEEVDAALVGGAFVDVNVVYVGIDEAELDPFETGVVTGGGAGSAEIGGDILTTGAPLGVGTAGLAGGVSEAGRLVVIVAVGSEAVLVIAGIHFPTEAQLPFIGEALDTLGLLLGLTKGGQKHRGQDGDDGDHHEQFDQGETEASA